MYVVYETDTGHSDESMRFATLEEAENFMAQRPEVLYSIRRED